MAAPRKRTRGRKSDPARYPGLAVTRREFKDLETGEVYHSAATLKMAIAQRHQRILAEFDRLVREGNLGQDPWERLPMESPLDYSRFTTYLRLGPDYPEPGPGGQLRRSVAQRSIPRAAHHLGLDLRTCKKLAAKYHWVLRGDCWQRQLDSEELSEMAQQHRRALARQQRLGQRLQSIAYHGLDVLGQDPERIATMTPTEIVRLAGAGVEIERKSSMPFEDPARDKDAGSITIKWEGPPPPWLTPPNPDGQPPVIDAKLVRGDDTNDRDPNQSDPAA